MSTNTTLPEGFHFVSEASTLLGFQPLELQTRINRREIQPLETRYYIRLGDLLSQKAARRFVEQRQDVPYDASNFYRAFLVTFAKSRDYTSAKRAALDLLGRDESEIVSLEEARELTGLIDEFTPFRVARDQRVREQWSFKPAYRLKEIEALTEAKPSTKSRRA